MKNFKLNIAYLAVFAMIFVSCSKEETGVQDINSEKVSLSFGAIVNEATSRESSKQAVGDIPECSSDDPAYVRIVLKNGDTEVVGTTASPYKVDLVPGQLFTAEDPMLELTPGTYTLSHFTVYNADDEVIWIAPRDGALAGFVDNPLPRQIELNAGVKKYVEVDVLCYDDRDVNQYGYLFFEINTTEAIEFCFFANYCDADGRHYAALYSVNIWAGTDATGDLLYNSIENTVGTNNDGDYFASPLCVALPTNADMNVDYLYYEITLLDWAENYGDVEQTVLSATLSRADIEANFGANDEVEYEHLRFGCGGDDQEPPADSDGDGIPDSTDDCPNEAGPASNSGCPEDTECNPANATADCDGDGVLNRCDTDNANYSTFDCDGDGFDNSEDACVDTPGVAGGEGGDGCPADTGTCVNESLCDIEDVAFPCVIGGINQELGFVIVNANESLNTDIQAVEDGEVIGSISSSYNDAGNLVLTITAAENFSISGYVLEVIPVDSTTGEMSNSCREISCTSDAPGDTVSEIFTNVQEGEKYFVRLKAIICAPVLP